MRAVVATLSSLVVGCVVPYDGPYVTYPTSRWLSVSSDRWTPDLYWVDGTSAGRIYTLDCDTSARHRRARLVQHDGGVGRPWRLELDFPWSFDELGWDGGERCGVWTVVGL